MDVKYTKDGHIISFETANEKARISIEIKGEMVVNPTIAMLVADGWEKVIEPAPQPAPPYIPTIEELVEGKVRERYSINQEFQVNRKRDTDKAAFDAYYAYVEECIAWANEQPHREED